MSTSILASTFARSNVLNINTFSDLNVKPLIKQRELHNQAFKLLKLVAGLQGDCGVTSSSFLQD